MMLLELFVVLLRWGRKDEDKDEDKDESVESPWALARRVVKARVSDMFAVGASERGQSQAWSEAVAWDFVGAVGTPITVACKVGDGSDQMTLSRGTWATLQRKEDTATNRGQGRGW
jgi:hypothetical protein